MQTCTASDVGIGAEVEIHSLSSVAGSRFNGCKGMITQINEDGRRVVKLQDSDNLPVVKPANLRRVKRSSSATSLFLEVVNLQSESGRLLNGLFCRRTSGKSNSNGRVVVDIFATGQQKSLKETNLVEVQLEDILGRLETFLRQGKLYDMQRSMRGLPQPLEAMTDVLRSRLAAGTYSEILDDSIELVEIPGKGKGYKARREVFAGEALLFDTAFCCARQGMGEYDAMAEQCKSKAASCVEAASFLSDHVMTLEIGNPLYAHFESRLVSVLKNNVFSTIRDREYCALFVAASRFNHSCCANAFADTSKDQAIIRALRHIEAGEEVCISYVPVHEPLEERQRHLSGKGFVCRCPRCEKEKRGDPQFAVPCECANFNFSAQENALPKQTCPECGRAFSKAETLLHIAKLEEMNAFMRTHAAASANPLDLIPKLEPLASLVEGKCPGSKTPKSHPQSIQLLNNLSGVHYFAATRVPGPHAQTSSSAALKYKRMVLSAMAANHGNGTTQRDLNFFMAMHRMLMGEFPSTQERNSCEKELEELCLLHFGQISIPAGVIEIVCR